jgi:hypothetical protein
LGKQANLGDKGDEGKEPSPLGPRVWERRWVSRDAQVMHNLATRVGDEGREPPSLEPRVGAAVGVERCSLRMQNLATGVTKAKSHHHRWSRVWERRWVSRDATWGCKQILVTGVTKAKSHIIVGAACGSGGGCREIQLGKSNLGDEGGESKEPLSLGPRGAQLTPTPTQQGQSK